jgi:autotransporter-associated beta strand protein
LNLNSTNTYRGGTFLNLGIINANTNGVFGTGGIECNSGTSVGRIVLGTGTTLTNSVLADTVAPGAATGLLMVGDNTNGTITTISGPISFSAGAANGGHFVGPTTSGYLNVSGPITMPASIPMIIRFGFLRFSGSGNYQEIQVRANTTSIGANNGIATNAVMDIGGNGSPTVPTYFDLNGFNQKLAGLKNTVTAANLGVVTNTAVTIKTLTLDLGTGNSYSFSGAVAGNVALILNSGTENFTGTNTYTGNTTINGGTLELATASIASNSTVTIANSALLQLDFPVTNTVGSLVLAGVSQAPGVYNSTTSPSFISGSGSLLVVPPVNTAPTNITAKVKGGNLELSWPADHTGWRLQVQTNALATGLNTNWVDVPNAAAGNSVTNAINAGNGAVFYRMVYP